MRPRRRTARSAGSTTVGAGSSAATTKPADSSVPMMAAAGPSIAQQAAQGAAQEGQRQQQPQMGRAHAGQQAHRPPASPSASMAPARCRNGPPGSPKQAQNAAMALQPSRGSSSSTARITGAALVAAACRASSQRMRARRRARERGGSQAAASFRKGPGGRGALTLPCREDRQCVFCGRSSPISRQPAGMVTHQTFARGRKIIWRNRRKSPKNVSVTTPNRRPAQFCVGVHVQCVSDRARTARPRIRDASGAQT